MSSASTSIQDRTLEFRSVLSQAQKRQTQFRTLGGTQRQSLLSDAQRHEASHSPTDNARRNPRSEFARRAAEIGRGITSTMAKLERLAQLAKRKTLFDDKPVEIAELTFVIKQDLSALNSQISSLQTHSRASRPATSQPAAQEGEHNKNVVVLLQGKLADVSTNFKSVLEVRTKNIQASRSRTENFVSSVGAHTHPNASTAGAHSTSASPLYSTTPNNPKSRSPAPGYQPSLSNNAAAGDLLSLDPTSPSSYSSSLIHPASTSQLLLLEEGNTSNSYIAQRGEAIEAIERTISELGGIFGNLASMVQEQSEMIQRIDANTEDVVDNVHGAQRELLKYWSRVSGNRWLVVKLFGVLAIFFLLWVLIAA